LVGLLRLIVRRVQEKNGILTAKILHLFMPLDNTEKLVFLFQHMTSTSAAQEDVILQYSSVLTLFHVLAAVSV
jgi:hypothetical protein